MDLQHSDLVTCKCLNCEGRLEFELAHTGSTVECPHCGRSTVLLVPQVPTPPLPEPTCYGEPVFFDQVGIVVTKTRFMAQGQTFAIANITSVSALTIPSPVGWWSLPLVFGVLLPLIPAAGYSAGEFSRSLLVPLVLGFALLLIAVWGLATRKPSYVVVLQAAGGEIKTCQNEDMDLILRVVAALNEAIVARG